MTHAQQPYDWVPQVSPELKSLDSIPLTGFKTPFNWEAFASGLSSTFEIQPLVFKPGPFGWKTKDELLEGVGTNCHHTAFSIPGFDGQIDLLAPRHETAALCSLLLTRNSASTTCVNDQVLIDSFYQFFILEALHQYKETTANKGVEPFAIFDSSLPSHDSLCQDIEIEWADVHFTCRLAISPAFRLSWIKFFENSAPSSALSKKIAEVCPIDLQVIMGTSFLSVGEWETIKEGDFLILDPCQFDPGSCSGTVTLMTDHREVFSAKLKNGHLKIIDRYQV